MIRHLGISIACALALATSPASADPIAIAFEGASECPTRGEVLDALGTDFGTQGERQITLHLGPQSISVTEASRDAVEREIPDADCATRARLIAIIVRGYARDGDAPIAPIAPPGPSAIPWAAAALGSAMEIDPLNGALALHLDAGLAFDAFRTRLAIDGTTRTGIGAGVDRLALLARIDVGAMANVTSGLELGVLIGAGAASAIVSEATHAQQIFRASPVVGASALLEAHLVGPLWLRAELGGDLPLIRDVYVTAPGIVPDGTPDISAAAPIVWLRALLGIAIRGE